MSDAGWVTGDATGLPIPMDVQALRDGGPEYLTRALHAFGTLAADDEICDVRCQEVTGGSTGRKAVLTVSHRAPGPHRESFVKFSRDVADRERDRGRWQMESEVAFAALSRGDDFPVAVPAVLFADYHRASGTGVLITERIPFGRNGVERQYEKCKDDEMPDAIGHYRALVGCLGRLAGMDASGRIPNALDVNMEELSVGERPLLTTERLVRRVDRLADFAAAHPGLLPENVRTHGFLARLRTEVPRLFDGEASAWRVLNGRTDAIALGHWNANVDNAWFWRDPDGTLQCGLMDWGCAGRMNVAMAIWGAMCSAETSMWDDHLDTLLVYFTDEFHRCGGGDLDRVELERHVVLHAAMMGMTWLLDVPGYLLRTVPDLSASSTRMDRGIRDVESARCRLQMLTNVLNLWERHESDGPLSMI
jgi:hypothetical protein